MHPHQPIWSLPVAAVYEAENTTPHGLTETDVDQRLQRFGYNELPEPARRSLVLRLTDQLTHFMAILLWVAGILAFISGTPELGWAIWAVIWINALFSFWQEFQAEQSLSALQQVLPAQVKVMRDRELKQIPARELVPGDVIQLEEGDRLSADARLVEAQSLSLDMSVLTGESLPVSRTAAPIETEQMRTAEATNLVFAGATVATGRATAVVYATGTHTEFGQVAHLTANVKREPSTLEIQITQLVHVITLVAVGMGVFIFILTNVLVGMSLRESFVFGIGIIVAFVPEGLLPTVSLALAIGVQRMAQKNALVRRLSAVETLSATTVICTDKTGTLTKNEMTVREVWLPRSQGNGTIEITGVGYDPHSGEVQVDPERQTHVANILATAALCCNAQVYRRSHTSQWQVVGDPTEAALLVAAMKAQCDLDSLKQQAPRHLELPFDSNRRMMSVMVAPTSATLVGATLDLPNTPYLVMTKGAPLDVVTHCTGVLQDGQMMALTDDQRSQISQANDLLASQGYRVLGVAWRPLTEAVDSDQLEQALTFLGLVAMIDPPRPEVAEAIAQCHVAGIRVTMITGDYGLTAAAIAHRIGLVNGKARIVTGEQLLHLSDAQVRQLLIRHPRNGLVFARMMPEQKLRLVQIYKAMGEIVAVTGDGVNDAPALRAGHIGIAMGLNGTDVAREAADIVLVDDNFATIVTAIEQGRAVYQNIRKFITYILASNMAEFLPFLLMVLLKIPPALVILQILAIDLGTDMIPALALGAERPEVGIMQQPPRRKSQFLLDQSLLLRAYCRLGLMEGMLGMVGFFLVWLSHGYDLPALQAVTPSILSHSANASTMAIYHQATTATLAAIVASQDGNVFACRSERISAFRLGFFSNPLIWIGILVEWSLIATIIFFPPFQVIFSVTPLQPLQWLALFICPVVVLLGDALAKTLTLKTSQS